MIKKGSTTTTSSSSSDVIIQLQQMRVVKLGIAIRVKETVSVISQKKREEKYQLKKDSFGNIRIS
jgi:uncharacterized protein (DUF362 family)